MFRICVLMIRRYFIIHKSMRVLNLKLILLDHRFLEVLFM